MEGEGSSSVQQQLRRTYSFVVEEDFVGLESDVDLLVNYLVTEDQNACLRVVSITGLGGLGKTTIAKMVYKHPSVKRHFNELVWICVSQQWQAKEILQNIMIKLAPEKGQEIRYQWTEDELKRELHKIQQEMKCLIVLDDIWTTEAWDCIKVAFPKSATILLTSRNRNVAMHIGPGFHHQPGLLSDDESWDLLRRKALRTRHDEGDDHHMKELEILGREMVKQCGGLPLAVIVLGGILLTKTSLSEWKMVHENIKSHLWRRKSLEKSEVEAILELSYYDLPYHLKPCFLYLGLFPEDTDIDADFLYQLWMAEGMVLNGNESMIELAESYLVELGQRSMVQLNILQVPGVKRKSFYCRLHDLMRDLCLLEVKREGFLTCIDQAKGIDARTSLSASSSSKHRRIAVNVVDANGSSSYIPSSRDITKSLRMFQLSKSSLPRYEPTLQLSKFEMLRVLRLRGMNLGVTNEIGNLLHLRYLSLRGCFFNSLPSSLGNLKNLQTLDLKGCSVRRLPNILGKMDGLICLYLPRFEDESKHKMISLGALKRLEILHGFDDSVCETEDLFKLANLRFLHGYCRSEENREKIENYERTNSTRLERVIINGTNFVLERY